jgi:hypothetical protein
MSSLQELKQEQEKKYLQHKAQEEKEKEKKRLETEAKMLKEIEVQQEYEAFLNKLENTIVDIQNSNDIVEIEFFISSFKSIIEANVKYIEYFREEISDKVLDLITYINNNENSKFNITDKNIHVETIINNIKLIMELVNLDSSVMDIELMDTSDDAKIAEQLIFQDANDQLHHFSLDENEEGGHRLGHLKEYPNFDILDGIDDDIESNGNPNND